MSADDMCIDYKLKFRIKLGKLSKGDLQLGAFLNRNKFDSYCRPFVERYLYICLFKINISIGFMV